MVACPKLHAVTKDLLDLVRMSSKPSGLAKEQRWSSRGQHPLPATPPLHPASTHVLGRSTLNKLKSRYVKAKYSIASTASIASIAVSCGNMLFASLCISLHLFALLPRVLQAKLAGHH